jgi:hypothetical protein
MFCATEHVFGGAEGVGSCFHILRSRTRFRRYHGRRLPFSCFARPNSFFTAPTASGTVLMSSLQDTFSAVRRVSGLVFMFCSPGLNFGGSEGVGSRFHILRPRTRFWRYRWHRVPFSCFRSRTRFRLCGGYLVSFSAVPRASGRVFMFCAPGQVFGGADGVGSLFHVLRSRTRFQLF